MPYDGAICGASSAGGIAPRLHRRYLFTGLEPRGLTGISGKVFTKLMSFMFEHAVSYAYMYGGKLNDGAPNTDMRMVVCR